MTWRRGFSDHHDSPSDNTFSSKESAVADGERYVSEKGGNNAQRTYQDASGAPVESQSPLGYSVGPATITLLNITMMIGAGIYSTRMFSVLSTQGVKLTTSSILYSNKHRICWSDLRLLDLGLLVMPRFWSGISRIHRVLPEQIRLRGRLPRTSLSKTPLALPNNLRRPECHSLFRKCQRHCDG